MWTLPHYAAVHSCNEYSLRLIPSPPHNNYVVHITILWSYLVRDVTRRNHTIMIKMCILIIIVLCYFLPAENMANFEVDLLMREAAVGEKMTFLVLYNPTGEIEGLQIKVTQ